MKKKKKVRVGLGLSGVGLLVGVGGVVVWELVEWSELVELVGWELGLVECGSWVEWMLLKIGG